MRALPFVLGLPGELTSTPESRQWWAEKTQAQGVDLSTLASYFGRRPDDLPIGGRYGWVADSLDSQRPGRPKVPRAEDPTYPADWDDGPPAPPEWTGELSDDFLHQVARYYGWAVSARRRPNVELAKATGRKVRTCQHWVYLARKRGILQDARPGRAG